MPSPPRPRIDGIERLARSPVVEDRSDRGSLVGRREEQISYLLQRPGRYTLPGWTLRWWNPRTTTLESHEFPARTLEVAPNPVASGMARTATRAAAPIWPWGLAGLGLIALAVVAVRLARPRWRRRRAAYPRSEPARYRQALAACRGADIPAAYQAVSAWRAITPGARDPEFERGWNELQLALVGAQVSWSGRALAGSIARIRREALRQAKMDMTWSLPPLNPRR